MAIDKRVLKNNKITYRVRIFNKKSVIKTAHFNRKIDAVKWELEQKSIFNKETYFTNELINIKFKELFNIWLINHAEIKKSKSSIIRDKQIYRDYLKTFDDFICNKINASDIESIIKKLLNEKRLSNKSINNILSLLRTVLNFGVKKRYLSNNPINSIEMLNTPETEYMFWTKEEISCFLKYTYGKYKSNKTAFLYYLISLTTGIRQGELIALKWDTIDFDNKLITIKRTYEASTKSIKEETKSKKIRFIGIQDKLLIELLNHRKNNSKTEFVLETSSNNHLDPSNFRRRNFFKDIKEANVRKIRIHDLRHTFASHFIMNGGSLFDLQQILGHSDTRTTMIYAHLEPKHIALKANIVNFSF